jgi:hypothetical protein
MICIAGTAQTRCGRVDEDVGATTVAVTSGIRSREFLEALEPNFLINGLPELIGLFK